MGIEDWGYRWLKRYMDAPQWVKAPLGRLYGLLPEGAAEGVQFDAPMLAEARALLLHESPPPGA